MEMIGRGEVAALEILKEMFGEFAEYDTQYPLTQMITEIGRASCRERV